MTVIIGIDPGLNRTGWGIVNYQSGRLSFVSCGVVTTNAATPLAARLKRLHDDLTASIAPYTIDEAAIEETFVNVNSASSLKLAHARGALMLTLSLHGLKVYEYTANSIKKTVTGSGHAEKSQVSAMVRGLLPGCRAASADATDALAVAVTHAQHAHIAAKLHAFS